MAEDSASFDLDYNTGPIARNPVQVTRYRQNIQRFRDYGNLGAPPAPVTEGRFKEGIQPTTNRFQPPPAGVQADFYRDSNFRNPNQPPLDLASVISKAVEQKWLYGAPDGTMQQQNATPSTYAAPSSQTPTQPTRGQTTRTATDEGITYTPPRRFGLIRRPSITVPRSEAQQRAITGVREARQQRASEQNVGAPAQGSQPMQSRPAQELRPPTNPQTGKYEIRRLEPEQREQQPRTLTPQQQSVVTAMEQQRASRQKTPPAEQPSTSRAAQRQKRKSRSGLGPKRALVAETLQQARGYLDNMG